MLLEYCVAAHGEDSGKQGRPPGSESGHCCKWLDWGPGPSSSGSRDGEERGKGGRRG